MSLSHFISSFSSHFSFLRIELFYLSNLNDSAFEFFDDDFDIAMLCDVAVIPKVGKKPFEIFGDVQFRIRVCFKS